MRRVFALVMGLIFPICCLSQPYPAKPLRIIVPFAPDGPPEAFAAHVKRESEKWAGVIRSANIVVN